MSGSSNSDPPEDDMEMLAAEVVLGLLTVAQLPHVVALRQGSTRFDNAVSQWELRLLPLAEAIEPVQPPAHIWRAIAAAIAPASEPAGIWDNIRFWRNFGFGTALLGAALAVALIAVLSRNEPPAPPMNNTAQRAGSQFSLTRSADSLSGAGISRATGVSAASSS